MTATLLFGLFADERCYACGREISRETRVAVSARSGEAGRPGLNDRRCDDCRAGPVMTVTEFSAYLAQSGFGAIWRDPASPCA